MVALDLFLVVMVHVAGGWWLMVDTYGVVALLGTHTAGVNMDNGDPICPMWGSGGWGSQPAGRTKVLPASVEPHYHIG